MKTLNLCLEDKVMDHYGDVHVCGSIMNQSVNHEDYTDMPESFTSNEAIIQIIRKDLKRKGFGLYQCMFGQLEAVLFVNCFYREDLHFAEMAICSTKDEKSIKTFKDAASNPRKYGYMGNLWHHCK